MYAPRPNPAARRLDRIRAHMETRRTRHETRRRLRAIARGEL